MTTTVLAYIPSPAQGVWHLGPVPIRAYALCIIAGIIVAMLIGDRRWVARGGQQGVIYDIAIWAVPFGLIGGRLYHLATDWKTYFGPGGAGIGAAARIWEGGLGIWGAVALGGVGAWIACRRRGIPLPAFGDAVAPGIILAQAIGRLGNYFNQELYGRETTVPWGLEIFYRRDPSGVVDVHSLDGVSTGQVAAVVHPTFLYEMLWNILVFVILIWADRKFRLGHGRLFALYVALYCVGRFWIELMRDDAATHIAGIRINVFTAMFVFIGAVVYMLLAPKGREDPATLRGKPVQAGTHDALTEELAAVAAGSGVVAAAKVAGEHETEDAIAVGDVDADAVVVAIDDTVTGETEEAEADEGKADLDESEQIDETAETDETDVVKDREDDELVAPAIETEAETIETDAETIESDAETIESDAETAETDAETAETDAETVDAETVIAAASEDAADESADESTIVVYSTEPETGTVVVYEDAGEDAGDADAVVVDDVTDDVTDVAEAESADAEVGVEPSAVTVSEAETDQKPVDSPVKKSTPDEADLVENVQQQASTKQVDAKQVDAKQVDAKQVDAADDDEAPKLGSTFKRLLFGAGRRG